MSNFLAYSFAFSENDPLSSKLMFGLEVTIIGILIVFAVLFLIMLIIYLFQAFLGEKRTSASTELSERKPSPEAVQMPASPASPASQSVNQEELVAAIAAATAMAQEELLVVLAAAVAAQEGCDPGSSRYRIRSFRRIL